MAEPTLKEIESARIDPEIGTGQPAVVYDDSQLLQSINQNAQFKAKNDWAKYQQFIGDYENTLNNVQAIADKEVADSDRDYLKKESVDLLSSVLGDPNKIYSPEFNGKLANIRANAASSKAARDFAERNAYFMLTNPQFNTDENKAKIDDYLNKQTVKSGGRKMFTLGMPEVFDNVGYFDALKKSTGQTIDASFISPDQQFIHERQDTKYGYKPFIELVKLGYESNPKIQKKAQKDFESLPPEIKRNFEDAKDYWVNFGSKHFGGYDDITMQGKEDIKANPQYLAGAELSEKRRHNKAEEGIGWANVAARNAAIDAAKEKIAKTGAVELPFTPLPAMLSAIGGYDKKVKLTELPVSMIAAINPNWLDEKGNLRETVLDANGKKKPLSGITISIDKAADGDNVYISAGNMSGFVNESKLKSNAESWLATYAKERKGQEVYGKIDELYQKAKETGQPKETKVDYNSLDPNGFTKEGKYWKYKDGTLFDDNGNVIKK